MPLDPGVQVERTLLAWRRTSLTPAVGGAALVHLSLDRLGAAGLVMGLSCIAVSLVAYLASLHRHRSAGPDHHDAGRPGAAGVPCALLVAAVLILDLAIAALLLERVIH